MSNMILDLVDFKDRVRPLANDLTLMDVTRQHQRFSVDEIEREKMDMLRDLDLNRRYGAEDQGYSSGEISEKSTM